MTDDSYEFLSQFLLGGALPEFSQADVKNEPMFFRATLKFAHENGGPITRAFLQALMEEGPPPAVIDSRVHMLMPGWLPAIPGWHHDDVPRSRKDGQPDYRAPAYHSRHALALVNGAVAPTEFAIGRHRLPHVSNGMVYGKWHGLIEDQIEDGTLERVSVPSNVIVHFDWQTAHRATPAIGRGWRWFGRATYDTDQKPANEIRRQVQVYLPALNAGW